MNLSESGYLDEGGGSSPMELLSSTSQPQQQDSPALNWLYKLGYADLLIVVVSILIILISIIGNLLVCIAIFTDRRLRKLCNAFIVSLAIADLFVSCLVMTFALCNDLMNYWIFGEKFCDIWISFDIMCSTASILNLCAISLDRFIHIKDCLLYNQWMTRRVAISAVIIIWFISALVSFVPINLGWHKPDHFDASKLAPVSAALGPSTTGAAASALFPPSLPGDGGQLAPAEPLSAGDSKQRARRDMTTRKLETSSIVNNSYLNNSSSSSGGGNNDYVDGSVDGGSARNNNNSVDGAKLNYSANSEPGAELQNSPLRSQPHNSMAPSSPPPPPNNNKRSGRQRREDFVSPNAVAGADTSSSGHELGAWNIGDSAWATHLDRGDFAAKQQFNQVELNPQDGSQIKQSASRSPSAGEFRSIRTAPRSRRRSPGNAIDGQASLALPADRRDVGALATPLPQPARQPVFQLPTGSARHSALASADLPVCQLNLTPTYAIVSSSISFFIPCIIMLALYIKLFTCARRHVKNIQAISKAPAPITATTSGNQSQGNSVEAQQSHRVSSSSCQQQQPAQGKLKTWLKFAKKSPGVGSSDNSIINGSGANQKAAGQRAAQTINPGAGELETADEQQPFLSSRQQQSSGNCLSRQEQASLTSQQTIKSINIIKKQHPASQGNLIQQQQSQSQSNNRQLATHKAAITLGIIMGTFLFCWVPFFSLNIYKSFCTDCIGGGWFRAFTWLGYLNSALNPIIYGIHNSEFRHAFNKIFFKHLNFKNSRYYINRRFSYDLRHSTATAAAANLAATNSTNQANRLNLMSLNQKRPATAAVAFIGQPQPDTSSSTQAEQQQAQVAKTPNSSSVALMTDKISQQANHKSLSCSSDAVP